jgi:hypothetical protein
MSVPSALGGTATQASVVSIAFTPAPLPLPPGTSGGIWSDAPTTSCSASTSKLSEAADQLHTSIDTCALAVEVDITELTAAISRRQSRALTPYNADIWEHALQQAGILHRYPDIPQSLRTGFFAGVPGIQQCFTPPNSPSIEQHVDAFWDIVRIEFTKGRYLGPFSQAELERAIGPFQTSPLSLVPKPGKPGKFRLIQNLSFPHSPSRGISSINSAIDSDLYPCTYGTFRATCILILSLPPGSQGATRDVAEAYRTIPLHSSQWPGMVVRLPGDRFALNSSNSFGCSSAGGVYGSVADAGCDLLRHAGIGPMVRWVDDHSLFRMLREHIAAYNEHRRRMHLRLRHAQKISGGRRWWAGALMPDNHYEEFDKDMLFPLRDCSGDSPRSNADRLAVVFLTRANVLYS